MAVNPVASTIVESIRRIVKTYLDSINKPLEPKADQPRIEGIRGIGYQSDPKSGTSTGSKTGTPGVTLSPGSGQAGAGASTGTTTKTGQPNSPPQNPTTTNTSEGTTKVLGDINGAGKVTTDTDPSFPVINTGDAGKFNVADVLDNLSDRSLINLTNMDPSLGINALSGFTDCDDSSKNGEIRFDGNYTPPPTWFSAIQSSELTTAEYWYLGYYWYNNVEGSTVHYSDPMRAALGGIGPYNSSGVSPLYTVEPPVVLHVVDIDAQTVNLNFRLKSSGDIIFTDSPAFGVTRQPCGVSTTGVCGLTTAPLAASPSKWPADGIFQLASVNGLFTASSYEPYADIPASYASPSSSAYMCFDGGARKAVIQAGLAGTKLLYEVNPSTGAPLPDSKLHVYMADGAVLTVTSISNLNDYIP